MNLHARIELFGGPEDGREITLPVSTEGQPLSPLPVPAPRSAGAEDEEVVWYERDHQRGRCMWVYKYANCQTPHPTEAS
ncbi:hypothetical protein [Actinopolyspora mortivallis]|uniref:Uncharacterized protein n=1 Tax=Actinopolyspora mortivallis TaxID=33906 RepID=A0A2T0GRK3_ACTMO|nr:hypothetical protein [Actinopolyspora mortivallis]PRW61736.1 hypothetical protein CEP50_19155 [Actinopolyspora mortivallis]